MCFEKVLPNNYYYHGNIVTESILQEMEPENMKMPEKWCARKCNQCQYTKILLLPETSPKNGYKPKRTKKNLTHLYMFIPFSFIKRKSIFLHELINVW